MQVPRCQVGRADMRLSFSSDKKIVTVKTKLFAYNHLERYGDDINSFGSIRNSHRVAAKTNFQFNVFLMPEHLQKYDVDESAISLLQDLGEWLKENGSYGPCIEKVEKCISPGLAQHVAALGKQIAALYHSILDTQNVKPESL